MRSISRLRTISKEQEDVLVLAMLDFLVETLRVKEKARAEELAILQLVLKMLLDR